MLIEKMMFDKAFREALKDFRTPIPNLFDIMRYFLLLFQINNKFCRLELVNNDLDIIGFPRASFYLYSEKDIEDEAEVIISKLKDWHKKNKFIVNVYITNTYSSTPPIKLFERNNLHLPIEWISYYLDAFLNDCISQDLIKKL